MPSAGWYGRRSAEAERIASGPKRAPARKLVAVSNGIPIAAASTLQILLIAVLLAVAQRVFRLRVMA